MSTIYRPKPVIYKPNDPFFKDGNIALKAIWLQKQAESDAEVRMIKEEEASLISCIPIYCESCRVELASVTAYELHYETMHRNVCSVCSKIFPNAYWLSLHIDEYHSIIVQMKKERGEKTYKCLVEGCPFVSATPSLRKEHLMKHHQYPAYFPFKITMIGSNNKLHSKTPALDKKEIHRERRRRQRRNRQSHEGDVAMREAASAKDEEMLVDNREQTPTMDTPVLLASVHQSNGIATARMQEEKSNMDIDELTSSMSKLKIPRQVLFGRGNKAPTFRAKQSR